ncbi:hypothetical protein BDV93DRAFT_504263 [Ceratobasidium sp. AG-I]|nr:hypothetical protein BDV93DRAFT_504263 [Ceratobasidium sp. AG-I]
MAPAATSATYKKSTTARHNAAPVAAKPKGLAKRVQFGVRTGISREEFAALVNLWEKTGGKPDSATRNALADELGRCQKQISVWFSNRRQNIHDYERERGGSMTAEERSAYIWTKYRAPAAEKRGDSSSSSDASSSGDASSVSMDYARASSGEASDYSSMNVSTPGDDYGDEVEVCSYAPFDQLVRVASLASIEHMQDREASEALLCLHRSHF